MKTYKKPTSIVVVLDSEDILVGLKAAGSIELEITSAPEAQTQYNPTAVLRYGGVAPADSEAGSKGWDCWDED